jgi:hypothetical protein
MKTYKVFEAKELENALEEKGIAGDVLFELLDDGSNDTAVCWGVGEPDSENDSEDEYKTAINIINEYMISQGCVPWETVFIYFFW